MKGPPRHPSTLPATGGMVVTATRVGLLAAPPPDPVCASAAAPNAAIRTALAMYKRRSSLGSLLREARQFRGGSRRNAQDRPSAARTRHCDTGALRGRPK